MKLNKTLFPRLLPLFIAALLGRASHGGYRVATTPCHGHSPAAMLLMRRCTYSPARCPRNLTRLCPPSLLPQCACLPGAPPPSSQVSLSVHALNPCPAPPSSVPRIPALVHCSCLPKRTLQLIPTSTTGGALLKPTRALSLLLVLSSGLQLLKRPCPPPLHILLLSLLSIATLHTYRSEDGS